MSFVYPSFLFALAAVAIPVLIHLFDLQRPKKVFFTNVSFLKNINEQTTSARKLKHLLVLMARIAAISFLVLAFAQPFIKSSENEIISLPQATTIYIDNSLSMQSEVGKGSLLDKSVENAVKLAELFPKSSKFYFLDNNFSGVDRQGVIKEKFKDRATEIQYANTYRTFTSIYKRAEDALSVSSAGNDKKIFWYSDFQKSTLGNISETKIDSSIQIYLLPIQNLNVPNLYIDSLWLDNYFVRTGENNTISVKIRSRGGQDSKKSKLTLFIDDVQAASTAIEIGVNSNAVVNFDIRLSGNTLKKCRLALDDNPIQFDDQYYFTLQPSGVINILDIGNEPKSFIKNVYANEANFSYTHNKFGNISLANIQKIDLVIVNGFDKLNGTEANIMKEYVAKGGSLLLFPSEKPDQQKIASFATMLKLPAISLATQGAMPLALKFPDTKNPFFENVFEKIDKNAEMPFGSSMITWGNKGNKLLMLSNNESFLSYFENQKGKVALCSSPLAEPYSDIQKHAVFVPVMYKLAINGSKSVSKPSYTFSTQNVAVKLEKTSAKEAKYTVGNDKISFIPEQRMREGNLYFDMPGMSMEPGFYEIKSGDSTLSTLAFNYDKNESMMSFYSAKELGEIFRGNKNIVIFDKEIDDSFISDFKNTHIGISLWKYCLAAALLFLLIEILLIRFKQ